MEMDTEEMDGGITTIRLRGRMDMQGAQKIDMKFTVTTTTKKGAYIVDMSQVDFLASIGIRTLLVSAKGAQARGGRLVLCSPTDLVANILETAGITGILPVFNDFAAARAAVTAA
jgi:anti-sigma B factor antagonist